VNELPLKIGFLTAEYPTEGYTGGIGSYVRQMAHALAELGHSVHILLAVPTGGQTTWDGPVPIHKVSISGVLSRLPWPLGKGASLLFASELAKCSRELDLDLLEAPEWMGPTAFLSLAKPAKLRVVVRLHTCNAIVRNVNKSHAESMGERLKCYANDWVERRSILTADAVTAVSQSIGLYTKEALRLPRADFRVVPNSVNDSAFALPVATTDSAEQVVLLVGRLEWRKGPDLLIRAVPSILKRQPKVLFRFAGSDTLTGPGNVSMRSYLDSLLPLDMQSSLNFSGHLGAAQLEEAWRQATVCVFPSRYEGLPMVCLEAMARGKAIVATDIPAFRELLSDGETGVIVGQDDPSALSDAIVRLVADRGLATRLGSAARDVARAQFHSKVVANTMLEFYREVLDREPASQPEPIATRVCNER